MDSPSKILLLLEAIRSVYEYIQSTLLGPPLRFISPKGDNHPVIIFPGLGASDGSTAALRDFLSDIGYNTYTWGQGRNLGPRGDLNQLISDLTCRVRQVSKIHNGTKVTLIGWSLGGIYVRELAKVCPELVRQVITIGTPFKGTVKSTNATFLYEFLNKDKMHHAPEFLERISTCPNVPFTSIYSKTDGVVHWTSSIENETPLSQNIEIAGASHLGLGHNPICMHTIAQLLAQPENNWQLYTKQ